MRSGDVATHSMPNASSSRRRVTARSRVTSVPRLKAIGRTTERGALPILRAVTSASVTMSASLFERFSVRIDEIAALVFRRVDDRHVRRVGELVERLARDAAILHDDHAALGPFAVLAEGDVAP